MTDRIKVTCPDCGSDRIDVYQTQETATRVEAWGIDASGRPEVEEYGKDELLDVVTNGFRCDSRQPCPGEGRMLLATDLVVIEGREVAP